MKTTKCFLAAAIFVATSFTFFACSSDDGDDGNNPAGPGVSSSEDPSSSSGGSSSSDGGSSSSSGNGGTSSSSSGGNTNGVYECDPDGTNPTVTIGSQVWMKCNLNVPHNSGNGESWCYEDDEENCEKYGRLYNWAAAMDICPEGFHVPTNAEWDALYRFADGDDGTDSPYSSPTAGSKLKAAEGWNPYEGISSTDEFGFSALPGGYRHSDGYFGNAGYYGGWWSASEINAGYAYYRNMYYTNGIALWSTYVKSIGYSVRCVQD
jgi:uncharacterized protein (TIGR02145 family)